MGGSRAGELTGDTRGGVFVLAGPSLAFILVTAEGLPTGLGSFQGRGEPPTDLAPGESLAHGCMCGGWMPWYPSGGCTGRPEIPFGDPRVCSKALGARPNN